MKKKPTKPVSPVPLTMADIRKGSIIARSITAGTISATEPNIPQHWDHLDKLIADEACKLLTEEPGKPGAIDPYPAQRIAELAKDAIRLEKGVENAIAAKQKRNDDELYYLRKKLQAAKASAQQWADAYNALPPALRMVDE